MIARIYINGIIGEDTSLLDVMRQYKSFANPESVEVIINSVGGSVDVGQSIYSYLRNLTIPVKTIAERAYSIASVIFMAGDERIVERGEDKLMIHFPFVQNATGRAEDLDIISKKLKEIEAGFIDFYSTLTSIDPDTIKSLLEKETFLSGDDAFSLGFATTVEIPLAAVAFYDNKEEDLTLNNKNFIMKNAEKLINALKVFVGTDEKTEVSALVLQNASGVEVNFPDVAEDGVPQVGDTALVDGVPAEGEMVFPDGSTMVFSGGSVSEILPSTEGEPEEEEALEEGEAVETEATEEVATEEVAEEEVSIEQLLEQLFAKATKQADENLQKALKAFQDENKGLKDEITAMKKVVGSADISAKGGEKQEFVSSGNRAVDILNKRRK